ncbi:MAG: hypothetical protein EPO07_06315, partial [Verrucomicrobia bacterium]
RLDASGRILLGGDFTSVNGTNRNRLARLNSDGSLDTGFDPRTGANGPVWTVGVQSDGKILVGGPFTTFNGVSRNGLTRLASTGAADDAFAPGAGVTNGYLNTLAIQSNGRILIGGAFTNYAGTARTNIARLTSSGSLDATFNPGAGPDGEVTALALQSDGRIIVGGFFENFDGVSRKHLARLNTNGTLDVTFNLTNQPSEVVQSVQVLGDDRILIAGDFLKLGGLDWNYVARLNTNGAVDTTFDPGGGWSEAAIGLAAQSDGRVAVGGYFTQIGGIARGHVARLHGRADGLSPTLAGVKSAGNYQVSFQSLTNLAYLLEYTDVLPARRWSPLAIVFGDGATRTLTDPAPNTPQRFYRLRTIYSEPYIFSSGKTGGTFQMSVPAFAWKTYVVEYKNSLSDAVWTPLPGVTGDNTLKVLSDTSANVAQRFYRVRAQ